MASQLYRIESTHPITHRFLPMAEPRRTFSDASVAVAFAAKCVPHTQGDEIRVVHVPSGRIIFRTAGSAVTGDEI